MRNTRSLIAFEFDQKIQTYLITLKNQHGEKVKIPAIEASKNKKLIRNLSAEDANRIGYMAGVSDTLNEQRALKAE